MSPELAAHKENQTRRDRQVKLLSGRIVTLSMTDVDYISYNMILEGMEKIDKFISSQTTIDLPHPIEGDCLPPQIHWLLRLHS